VKQKNDNDLWLIDGGGMIPNQKDYSNFLKNAVETPTVGLVVLASRFPGPVFPAPVPCSRPRSRPDIHNDIYFHFYLFVESTMRKEV
jgi:hypothetical protein